MTGRQPNPTSIDREIEQDISWLMGDDPVPSESSASSEPEPSVDASESSTPSPEPETIPPIPASQSPSFTTDASPAVDSPSSPAVNPTLARSESPAASVAEPTVADDVADGASGASDARSPISDTDQASTSPETILQPGMVPTEPDASTVSAPEMSEVANPVPSSDTATDLIDTVPDSMDRSAASSEFQASDIPIDQAMLRQLTLYQQQHGEAATQDLLSRMLIGYEQRNGIPGTNEVLRRVMQAIQDDEGAVVAESVVSNLREDLGETPLPQTVPPVIANLPAPEAQMVPPPPMVEPAPPAVPTPTAVGDSSRQNLLNFLPLALVAAIAGTALTFTLLRREQNNPSVLIALSGWNGVVIPSADAFVGQILPPSPDPAPPVDEPDTPVEPNPPPPSNPDLDTDQPAVDPSFEGPDPNPSVSPTTLPAPLPGVPLW